MRAHFGLPSVEAEDKEGKPPISVKFEIPYFTTSGIQVWECACLLIILLLISTAQSQSSSLQNTKSPTILNSAYHKIPTVPNQTSIRNQTSWCLKLKGGFEFSRNSYTYSYSDAAVVIPFCDRRWHSSHSSSSALSPKYSSTPEVNSPQSFIYTPII